MESLKNSSFEGLTLESAKKLLLAVILEPQLVRRPTKKRFIICFLINGMEIIL
jgi:hypothetical protein